MTRRPAPLYLPESDIAALVGMSALEWQAAAGSLEKLGLPRRDPLFNGRRYWPAVRAFLDRRAGLSHDAPAAAADGEENWRESPNDRRVRGPRPQMHEAPGRAR